MNTYSENIAQISTALADPTRREIMELVIHAGSPLSVREVADHFGLHANAARMHLDKLVKGGLLKVERQRGVLGARLRTKLVVTFLILSLAPTVLLFFAAFQFVGTSMEYWFSAQVENSLLEAMEVSQAYNNQLRSRAARFAGEVAVDLEAKRWSVEKPSMYLAASSASTDSPSPRIRTLAPRISRWKLPSKSNVTSVSIPANFIQPVTLFGAVLSSTPSISVQFTLQAILTPHFLYLFSESFKKFQFK